jgi:hypothetical protein
MNDGRNEDSINSRNNILRRLSQSQAGSNLENIEGLDQMDIMSKLCSISHEFKQLIYNHKCFSVSGVLFTFLIVFLSFSINRGNWEIESLESEDMAWLYFLLYLAGSVLTWNFYLGVNLLIGRTRNIKSNADVIILADTLYFNPLLATFMAYFYDKAFLQTSFDAFVYLVITTHYFISFCFTINLYKHTDRAISEITNFSLPENTYMINRSRVNYVALAISNLTFTFFLKMAIRETDFMYKYFLILKVREVNMTI